MIPAPLRFDDRVAAAPVIHGSGDFSVAVRRLMLEHEFDCLAVPLPESFQPAVEAAIERLPAAAIVTQRETPIFQAEWSGTPLDEEERELVESLEEFTEALDFLASLGEQEDDYVSSSRSYVPIDPCQPVIAALRSAIGEHIPRRFIDLETARFEPYSEPLPDPYALKKLPLAQFAAAVLPAVARPEGGQRRARIAHMAAELRRLARRHRSVLLVCSVLDWPWIREAYLAKAHSGEHEQTEETETWPVQPETLLFLLGELPFITGLYERARGELEDDENLSIDGVKEMLLAARDAYSLDLKGRARKITPALLRQCLKYIRNLSLVERRMTPDLYTLVVAARQIVGDQFALHVAETAGAYPFTGETTEPAARMGIGRAAFPGGDIAGMVSRLPGPPVIWRSCELKRRPERRRQEQWRMRWNPFSHCSWPPEDELIEDFRAHVFQRAKAIMGADLARTEKFTTSLRDGLDIRETVRHWYEGELYVKVLPPSRGRLDAAVMLFDSPADPRDYPWRTTWYAEHEEESTLAFFATDFGQELVGPGIAMATYGGAMFLFPPVSIPDIWHDPQLDFAETLEERLLAAACLFSECRQIALLSRLPPGAGWRRLARRFGRTLVHVPLAQFSEQTVQQLRMVHVLNGRQVRSYAAEFIRKA